jgi:hypothetical protein
MKSNYAFLNDHFNSHPVYHYPTSLQQWVKKFGGVAV